MVITLSDDEFKVILESLDIAVEKYSAERITFFKKYDSKNYLLCGEKKTSARLLLMKLKNLKFKEAPKGKYIK